jgi:hypothetical protein
MKETTMVATSRRLILAAFLCVMGLGIASSASAHHSFAATYFVDRTITVKGSLVQFLYRNPHSFIKINGPDEKGVMQTWSIEWGGGGQLSNEHVTRDTLKPGDQVIVTGNPGRDPEEHRIRLQSITRPSDGWKWSGVIQ